MDSSTEKSLFVPGAIIGGRYEVVDTLGSGGMGTVVRVIDRALDDEVLALKLLYPHMARDDTQFARFRNEVLIARKLAHPNIVRLFDFGAAGQGYYYISMEYVRGGNLSDRIYAPKENRMGFADCMEILYEICMGLAAAHSYGVVHRDLKPDNILMNEVGQVKISDFGLARSVAIERGLTATGDTVGTPYYMAPEQLRGDKLDRRVDLYALGIVAYEMVMGKRPFLHDTYLTLAAMHFKEPIPKIAGKDTGIPIWFQEFIERLAAKRPEDRYSSADEAAAVIAEHMGNAKAIELKRRPAVLSFYEGQGSTGGRSKLFLFTCVLALVLVAVVFSCSAVILKDDLKGTLGSLLNSKPAPANVPAPETDPQFFSQVREGDKGMVEFFLNRGADANAVDQVGTPAMHYAVSAKDNRKLIIELLFSRGALPDAKDKKGMTPLLFAAKDGRLDAAQALVTLRADVNAVDSSGKTALHYAVLGDHLELVEMLVKNGAAVGIMDPQGKQPKNYIGPRSAHKRKLQELLKTPERKAVRQNVELSTSSPAVQATSKPRLASGLVELKYDKAPKYERLPGVRGIYKIRAEIRNRSSVRAENLEVFLEYSDGTPRQLKGLPHIDPYGSRVYVLEEQISSGQLKGAKVTVLCSNCSKD